MRSRILQLASMTLLLGCSAETELPGGYTLIRIDSANRLIVDVSNEMVVLPDVQSCQIVSGHLIGTRKRSEYPIIPEHFERQQPAGHFALDLSDGSLRTGLSPEDIDRLVANDDEVTDCMPFRLIGH